MKYAITMDFDKAKERIRRVMRNLMYIRHGMTVTEEDWRSLATNEYIEALRIGICAIEDMQENNGVKMKMAEKMENEETANETIVDNRAYHLGQIDADRRNKPMKVTNIDYDEGAFQCPNCKRTLRYEIGTHLEFIHHCDCCGQALDWPEQEG